MLDLIISGWIGQEKGWFINELNTTVLHVGLYINALKIYFIKNESAMIPLYPTPSFIRRVIFLSSWKKPSQEESQLIQSGVWSPIYDNPLNEYYRYWITFNQYILKYCICLLIYLQYGFINICVKQLVLLKFGEDAWKAIW